MTDTAKMINDEIKAPRSSGMLMLIINILLIIVAILFIVLGSIALWRGWVTALDITLFVVGIIWLSFPAWVIFAGLKVVRPNEAYVFTLFGKYYGTIREDGFFFVNPFVTAVNPLKAGLAEAAIAGAAATSSAGNEKVNVGSSSTKGNRISLKAMTLSNNKQKINDLLGNPIEIGIVVVWRVVNTARAVFNVDNFEGYLSMQSDSALRNIVRLYPYDVPGEEEGELSLRGSSQEIAACISEAIQEKVVIAGLEIVEARITHLAYAPEIAAAMLQRQQASAIVDARALIVKGAVGMVQQALSELDEAGSIELDEERKAAMVSNLLVVLCGNRDAQPVVNSGSLY
jgi:regulator of protease activity HflC (stomatin/prohibitin superfamily)